VLAVSLADGTLEIVDTVHSMEIRPRQQRLLRWGMLGLVVPIAAHAMCGNLGCEAQGQLNDHAWEFRL
jgi:hypothetical protein